MAQDILTVDGYGCGICSDINQGTTRTFFCLGKYTVGECQRCKEHLCDVDASYFETFVQVAVEGLAS